MRRIGLMVLVAWFLIGCGESNAPLTFYERIRSADEIGNATIGPGYVSYVRILMRGAEIDERFVYYDTTNKATYECHFQQECIYELAPYNANEAIDVKALPVTFDYVPTVEQLRKDFLLDETTHPRVTVTLFGDNPAEAVQLRNSSEWMILFNPDRERDPSAAVRSFLINAMTGEIIGEN